MSSDADKDRRGVLLAMGAAGAGLVVGSWLRPGLAAEKGPKDREGEVEVSPAEDLMREHGILRRVLLIYEEVVRRTEVGKEVVPEVVSSAAAIIHDFIEEYHEKLEEDHIFPRFKSSKEMAALAEVLRAQHAAGRRLTEAILRISTTAAFKGLDGRHELASAAKRFIRMYRPHAAREDTVLFPAFHQLLKPEEYDALGDRFEDRERALFGEGGFEKMVQKVAGLEQDLGIDDLASFTPGTSLR